MADATSQPGTTPPAGGQPPAAADPGGTTTPPAGTPPAPTAPVDNFDPSKLTQDQLNKVLENQELWKNPRLAGLLDADKQLKQLQKDKETQTEQQLTEQKKFQELAEKRAGDLTKAQETIQTMRIDQALTNKLVKDNVVDLDGALKLVDRSKLAVDDNGQVTGVDEALGSLKTDRAYLFTSGGTPPPAPSVGNPSNPQAPAGGSGQFKFKESQLTPEFYKAHAVEINEAGRLGLIEQDGPPPMQ
jgi:hypothetical protein